MFRRITALVCALALAGALSWTAQAAPVTGSFGLDLVFYPQSAIVDPASGRLTVQGSDYDRCEV
jgi:hypothetical protein